MPFCSEQRNVGQVLLEDLLHLGIERRAIGRGAARDGLRLSVQCVELRVVVGGEVAAAAEMSLCGVKS